MEAPNPFSANDYKKIIRKAIEANAEIRGYQGKLAAAAGCQNSYLSKVLGAAKAHLSPEQGLRVAQFWRLGDTETDYFLELIGLARTTYAPLVARTKERLRLIKERHENLSSRGAAVTLAADSDWLYYSAWYWSALHIIVGIPRYQTAEAAARALQLDRRLVDDVLQRLAAMGMVAQTGGRWAITPTHRHLPRESPLSPMNHANWRQRAVVDSYDPTRASLHYTVVNSHGEGDFERIKQAILGAIDQVRAIVRPAPDEDLSCLCIDLFRPVPA